MYSWNYFWTKFYLKESYKLIGTFLRSGLSIHCLLNSEVYRTDLKTRKFNRSNGYSTRVKGNLKIWVVRTYTPEFDGLWTPVKITPLSNLRFIIGVWGVNTGGSDLMSYVRTVVHTHVCVCVRVFLSFDPSFIYNRLHCLLPLPHHFSDGDKNYKLAGDCQKSGVGKNENGVWPVRLILFVCLLFFGKVGVWVWVECPWKWAGVWG